MRNFSKAFVYSPIVFALLICVGIFIGKKLNCSYSKELNTDGIEADFPAGEKITNVIEYITENYVDSVNENEIAEKAIIELLHNLDPHSSYISAKDLKEINEQLEGNFEGVGIEFNILRDTICVISVIPGGPSEMVGIMAGDKIIKVEQEIVAGMAIKNKDITSKLRGEKGTKVKVSIMRNNKPDLIDFVITRDEIPLYSIDVFYMLTSQTGYIKLSRFAETSHEEFMEAIKVLIEKGMKNLVFDLRGNGGGLLNIAAKIADEFLENGKMIVYTQGNNSKRKEYKASNNGSLTGIPLIILIDENSASASEIIAGAIQDNDRGIIIGRRSFGKGLVQSQTELPDGSAIRLTTARYYTPTGRCIQKPYDKGLDDYYNEEEARYQKGELQHQDSIHFPDSLKYKTPKGKTVYGGGGIMPDIFIPIDTAGRTNYLSELFYKGIFNQFSFDYAASKRTELLKGGLEKFTSQFEISPSLFANFISYASQNGIKKVESEIKTSEQRIKQYLKASIARSVWNDEGFYPIYNQSDHAVKKAISYIEEK